MSDPEKIVHTILSGRTVLVVDDDSFMRTIISSYLQDVPDIDLQEASGAHYAYYCLNDTSKKLILVITDIVMPEVNGFEILKNIRSGNTRAPRDLPVIVISSDNSFKLSNLAQKLDANAYIIKPLNYDEFIQTIIKALSQEISLMPSKSYDSVDTTIHSQHIKIKNNND